MITLRNYEEFDLLVPRGTKPEKKQPQPKFYSLRRKRRPSTMKVMKMLTLRKCEPEVQ